MFYKTVISSGVCSPSIVSEHGKAREDIPCGLLVRSVAPCALFGGLRSRLLLGGFNGLLNRLSGLLGLSLGGLLLGFGRLLGLGGLVVAEKGFADHGAGNGAGGGTHHVGHEAAALLLGLGGSGVRGGRSLLGGRLIGGRRGLLGRSGGGSRLRGGLRGGGGTARNRIRDGGGFLDGLHGGRTAHGEAGGALDLGGFGTGGDGEERGGGEEDELGLVHFELIPKE